MYMADSKSFLPCVSVASLCNIDFVDNVGFSRECMSRTCEDMARSTFESDLSRTMNSMSKRDKRESGRLMLRVIPWL